MEQIKQSPITPNTEWPVPIEKIYSGPNSFLHRSTLNDYKNRGLIKFHYLGNKPFVYISEINAAMVVKDIHQ